MFEIYGPNVDRNHKGMKLPEFIEKVKETPDEVLAVGEYETSDGDGNIVNCCMAAVHKNLNENIHNQYKELGDSPYYDEDVIKNEVGLSLVTIIDIINLIDNPATLKLINRELKSFGDWTVRNKNTSLCLPKNTIIQILEGLQRSRELGLPTR